MEENGSQPPYIIKTCLLLEYRDVFLQLYECKHNVADKLVLRIQHDCNVVKTRILSF